jgi:hypothetical protein
MMICAFCEWDDDSPSRDAVAVAYGMSVCEEHLHANQPIPTVAAWAWYKGQAIHAPSFRAGQKSEREAPVA